MGKEGVKLPKTPAGWAVRISATVKVARDLQGLPRFPIDIKSIAKDFSQNLFPDEPISLVQGDDLGNKFEGMLTPNPKVKGEWGIIYNSAIRSRGRINFTLGHELGHYFLHRSRSGNPIYCSRRDMWAWDSEYGLMEAEANEFASHLLMPLDDFRQQTALFRRPLVADFEALRDRYEVSLTAAILKWLDATHRRVMFVVSKDGFIDWARSSSALLKSGVFFRARQETIPIPDASLAALGPSNAALEIQHPIGVWNAQEPVFESVMFSEYHDAALSLLHFPDQQRWSRGFEEEPELMDAYEKFQQP
jgi:hypothetical protein